MTEDCDRKIRARWAEEQAEIEELKREKRRLQKDVEDMREREKATQAAVHDIYLFISSTSKQTQAKLLKVSDSFSSDSNVSGGS